MEKFYDNCSLLVCLRQQQATGYPQLVGVLGVMMHLGPRVLKAAGHMSQPLAMFGALAPGCGQATSFTKAYLYSVCEQMTGQASGPMWTMWPKWSLEQYVDDLTWMVTGTRGEVARIAARGHSELIKKLKRVRCRVANKSVLLASTAALR